MFRRSIPIYYKRVMKQLCLLTTTLQINSESRQVQNTPATKNHLISTCAQRKMRDVHFGKSVGCTCVGLELVVNDNGRVVVVAFLVVLCLFPLCPATWLTRLFHACQPQAKD